MKLSFVLRCQCSRGGLERETERERGGEGGGSWLDHSNKWAKIMEIMRVGRHGVVVGGKVRAGRGGEEGKTVRLDPSRPSATRKWSGSHRKRGGENVPGWEEGDGA